MLSNLIKELQDMYDKHGDMPIIAGHVDTETTYSWGDEIPYDYFRHFPTISPSLTNIITEDFTSDGSTFTGIRFVEVHNDIEDNLIETNLPESLAYSILKTAHNQQEKQVLCLQLSNHPLLKKED